MNKKTLVLCACLTAVFATSAMAQSVIWMDWRANDGAQGVRTITGNLVPPPAPPRDNPFRWDTVNGGRKGAGQLLMLEPVHADSFHTSFPTSFPNSLDADGNRSNGDLWIYMDVNDDPSGTGDVISSVGLDADFVAPATVRNTISSIALTLNNDNTVFNSITPVGAAPWNNKIDGAMVAGSPPDWAGAKAVRVPVEAGPTYNAALGIQNRPSGLTDIPYRLGKIRVQAGTRVCPPGGPPVPHVTQSTYNVFLKANNLLITRVFNGAGDADEQISFGYDAVGAPELPTISGNTQLASALPDAQVIVRMKGDFSGDGRATTADNALYLASVSDPQDNVTQAFVGDFSGDDRVTTADNAGYLASITASTSCP